MANNNHLKIKEASSDELLLKVEKVLLRASKLKFKDLSNHIITLDKESPKNVIELILKFNQSFDTVANKSNRVQCTCRKHRSQGDLFRIVRYYSDISLKDFRATIFELINNGDFMCLYCPDIRKIVTDLSNPSYGNYSTMLLTSEKIPKSWLLETSEDMLAINYNDSWFYQTPSAKSFTFKDELGLISKIAEL
jgi:hypothetical protein